MHQSLEIPLGDGSKATVSWHRPTGMSRDATQAIAVGAVESQKHFQWIETWFYPKALNDGGKGKTSVLHFDLALPFKVECIVLRASFEFLDSLGFPTVTL